eukprot:6898295-Prymnesium_polylepis.1
MMRITVLTLRKSKSIRLWCCQKIWKVWVPSCNLDMVYKRACKGHYNGPTTSTAAAALWGSGSGALARP